MQKPTKLPQRPHFSSGPCVKRPGWSLSNLSDASLGRSHRAKIGKARLEHAIELSKKLLGLPEGYVLGIVPASDTGAFEMAMWSLLGPRGVDVFSWESFGQTWASDIKNQLKLPNVRYFNAEYGQLPNLQQADKSHDCVFTWNGTTSGVRVPNGDWIADDREGLTLCDATSAVFAMDMPWEKLDVVTYSWQKVLGGEGAHGVIILSPRAIARLESYTPAWPMPKIFRLTSKGKLNAEIFEGSTINTPSMLCVEDLIDALEWSESIGGLSALMARSEKNLHAIEAWVAKTGWVDFLAVDKSIRSNTSVCLAIVDAAYKGLPAEAQAKIAKKIASLLESEKAAYDIGSYRDAPPGLRIWAGATVETSDLEALFPWLDWAFAEAMRSA
jgi:phosphoserine aminotransferase